MTSSFRSTAANRGRYWCFLALCAVLLLSSCAAPLEDVSVLVVSADSLRVDRLPLWNPRDAPSTPNLDLLVARGTVYRNAWATSPWTAPSMVSLFTGLYPPSRGIVYRDDTTSPTLPTLPRMLEARGYRLGNFSFFSGISYFRNLGLGEVVKGIGHRKVAGGFRRWLEGVPGEHPFFAWVHLLEPHLPYGASGYRAAEAEIPGSTGLVEAQLKATVPFGTVEFETGDREPLLELYDRDVRDMDRVLGKVLEAVEATGRAGSTVVVFVADHGEELLDHDWVGHASTAIRARLHPEILRVPLVLAGPGIPAGEVRDELVQQVDVMPTLARLFGLAEPPELDGRPLPGIVRPAWPWGRRQRAFFDSSPGGNLTPQDQRGDRLQGVTDGGCLVAVHTFRDRPKEARSLPLDREACDGATEERLRRDLASWREQQIAQRLAVLARYPAGEGPASEEVDGYAEAIEILSPSAGERLRWEETGGQIALQWTGRGESYWIEYRLSDLLATSGSLQVEQQRVVFGPVPQGFWNDLAGYSPFRIRLVDTVNRERSRWTEYEVLPSG